MKTVMNPNMTFAFIGGPLVAMQIMKLYQKEGKAIICIYQYYQGEKREGKKTLIVTHFCKNVIITVYALFFLCLEKFDSGFFTT